MLEIALCLAIIGFALVALIGILPTGLAVQKENREDTIINQDGTYFLHTIEEGSQGIVDLEKHVLSVNGQSKLNGAQIIGRLTRPTGLGQVNLADVLAISGVEAENGIKPSDVGFRYQLTTQITPLLSFNPNAPYYTFTNQAVRAQEAAYLQSNLWEIRLVLRWPILGNNPTNVGSSKQVFRTLVSGRLVEDPTNSGFFYFRSQ